MPDVNKKLLAAVKQRGFKREPFAGGILPADRYVRTMLDCVGSDLCNRFFSDKKHSFHDALKRSEDVLTYHNPDMEVERRFEDDWTKQYLGSKQAVDGVELELPKNTLMVFRHVLTTPRKDRDGDVLRTQGATVDPKLPMLWQHVHTLPIGKMLGVAEHTANKLSLISAIVDINELSHDAAVMIDNGMGRFSHGFRALEFSELKEDEGEVTGPPGFDITKFEIMEASIVSVPSNVDAETEDVLLSLIEGDKLTSDLMKEAGRVLRDKRPTTSRIRYVERTNDGEKTIETTNAADFEKVFKQTGERNGREAEPTDDGQGKGKGQGCSCPSKEADGNTGGRKEGTATTADAQVKCDAGGTGFLAMKRPGGPLTGSWEWIEDKLRRGAERFLSLSGAVPDMANRFVWLAGTFSDHAVICAEHREFGVPNEFLYFKSEWEIADDEPKFKGEPEPVELVTTAEMRERSPLFESKGSDGTPVLQRAGRVLSRANMRKLEDVRADLEELRGMDSLTRAATAICDRCVTKLSEVIRAAGGDADENDADVTPKRAMAIFVANASDVERKRMRDALDTFDAVAIKNKQAEEYRALMGVSS